MQGIAPSRLMRAIIFFMFDIPAGNLNEMIAARVLRFRFIAFYIFQRGASCYDAKFIVIRFFRLQFLDKIVVNSTGSLVLSIVTM